MSPLAFIHHLYIVSLFKVNTAYLKYNQFFKGQLNVNDVLSGPVIPLKKTYEYYAIATKNICAGVTAYGCNNFSKVQIIKSN